MDFDFEITNEEEGDCPDHLFESIMNAMTSMKEATADKIYQKIQRDGESSYSKPQVDRALANALKYGIFEVKNNRYRVRDEILDDEDTIYWKLHEKKEQTPLRIQEGNSQKYFGIKLDPERDNQRFRKIENSEVRECPHCGKIKKNMEEKSSKVAKTSNKDRKKVKKSNPKNPKKRKIIKKSDRPNRKTCKELKEISSKKKSIKRSSEDKFYCSDSLLNDFWTEVNEDMQDKNSFNSPYSNSNLLKPSESCGDSQKDENFNEQRNHSQFHNFSDGEDKKSSLSFKSGSFTNKSSYTLGTDTRSQSIIWDNPENFSYTSRDDNNKTSNQYLGSNEVYHDYDNSQTDQHKRRSNWMDQSDEPQGNIIQSKNVLTIEPMDTLAFKTAEQASYIS